MVGMVEVRRTRCIVVITAFLSGWALLAGCAAHPAHAAGASAVTHSPVHGVAARVTYAIAAKRALSSSLNTSAFTVSASGQVFVAVAPRALGADRASAGSWRSVATAARVMSPGRRSAGAISIRSPQPPAGGSRGRARWASSSCATDAGRRCGSFQCARPLRGPARAACVFGGTRSARTLRRATSRCLRSLVRRRR